MMNKPSQYIVFIACALISLGLQAQQLTLHGRITFERKENMHKMLDDEGTWGTEMRKRMPKFRTDYFQLHFNTSKSLYKISQEDENTLAGNFWRVSWNNEVLTDLKNNRMISEKTVYDKGYHVEDSIPALQWKITGEYRDVAGYTCRKATTIIMDSLYVIAFYTDQIPASFGPESFQGLPGMILGVVVPKINYTFFATKVENMMVEEKQFTTTPLKKAQKVTRATMLKEIGEAINDWGKWGRKIYWRVVL